MKDKHRKTIFYWGAGALLLTFIATIYVNFLPNYFQPPETDPRYEQEYLDGHIMQLGEADEDGSRNLKVKFSSGEEKGSVRDVLFDSNNNFFSFEEGDKITVYKTIDTETGNTAYTAADYFHMDGIFLLFVIFTAVALIVARKKGFRAIVSVLASLVFFYFFFIKFVGLGLSPIWGALIFVTIVTLVSIPLIHGFNRKSLSSIIAILVGYAASILVVYLFRGIVHIGNAPGEEFRILKIMFGDINLGEVLLASLFLGAVGALIDTAISISSAIFEALQESPNTTFKKVYKIGMNVGNDILGSMINTLLFAYIASSLPFLVLLSLSQESGSIFYNLMNMDFIALELTRTFIGAVSLVLVIPLVSATSAYFLTKGGVRR